MYRVRATEIKRGIDVKKGNDVMNCVSGKRSSEVIHFDSV